MGNIIQELFSHFVNLDLVCNILLQFIVGRFQLGNGLFQLSRHFIEIIAQLIDLISCLAGIPGFKIQICHFSGKLRQLRNWLGNPSGHCHNAHSTYNNNDNSYEEIEFVGNICTFPNTFQRTSD